jgi:hypothetical protein
MPVSDAIDKENEAFLKENSWATSPEELNKQETMFKEDLEREMPELYSDKEEVISF